MINAFDNPRLAQAFVDYMATQGVVLDIQRHDTWDVWLADESQAERVKAELSYFLAHPSDPRYLSASWQTGQLNAGLRYRSYPFMATVRAHAGPLTLGMMALCIVAYLAMSFIGYPQVAVWLAWPFDPSLKFQLWRYVSPLLLHFSLLSLIFNLLWWWYLAGPLEKMAGSGKLLTLTLVTALVGGVIQYQVGGPWFGASAAWSMRLSVMSGCAASASRKAGCICRAASWCLCCCGWLSAGWDCLATRRRTPIWWRGC